MSAMSWTIEERNFKTEVEEKKKGQKSDWKQGWKERMGRRDVHEGKSERIKKFDESFSLNQKD